MKYLLTLLLMLLWCAPSVASEETDLLPITLINKLSFEFPDRSIANVDEAEIDKFLEFKGNHHKAGSGEISTALIDSLFTSTKSMGKVGYEHTVLTDPKDSKNQKTVKTCKEFFSLKSAGWLPKTSKQYEYIEWFESDCGAIQRLSKATPAKHTNFLPDTFYAEELPPLPSSLLEGMLEDGCKGKHQILSECIESMGGKIRRWNSLEIRHGLKSLEYKPLALADFNGDGWEDMLLRGSYYPVNYEESPLTRLMPENRSFVFFVCLEWKNNESMPQLLSCKTKFPSYTQKQKCLSSLHSTIPNLYNVEYTKALAQLQKLGWEEAYLKESYAYIKEQTKINKDYKFLAECSGIRETFCRLTLNDKNGRTLEVQTVGGEVIDRDNDSIATVDGSQARIVNWGILCDAQP